MAVGMLSAAGGYDIPAGVNPIVQTHAQEMILPAKYANPLRSMLTGGGGGTSNTSTTNNSRGGDIIHIHATDAQSVARMIANNPGAIAEALAKGRRQNKLTPGMFA